MSKASDLVRQRFQAKKKKSPLLEDTIRIGVYRRVSTREQADEGMSLFAQEKKIENYIKFESDFTNKSLIITDYLDKGLSAKDMRRKALQKMIVDLDSLDLIIVVKLDRLTRRIDDLLYLLNLFNKNNVSLISINEKLDTETATGRFFITILGSLAQLEREQISERVKDVMDHLVTTQPVGSRAPFGYFYLSKQSSNDIGAYIPYIQGRCQQYNIPPIQEGITKDKIFPGDYVSLIFTWYRNYKNYSAIAKRLTDLYVPTPAQITKAFTLFTKKNKNEPIKTKLVPITVNEPLPWSHVAVQRILSNSFYTGVRIWNRYENLKKSIRDVDDWKIIPNSHESLISEAEFELAFNIMNSNKI